MSKFEKLLEFISYLRIKRYDGELLRVVLSPAQKKCLKYLVENEK